eukprot:CAMPEP_0202736878 /NCGR_PEP_ID=MMETSP1388-20130828/1274_1 /ASSEMBLY_ACC=CAM_ASM_000864 /TAXON_ID=37098 /ORGANISM="Isochrysis sp, Strain CCMP1244" /LENGTH=196 /DNA_ID=CAMNT_0049403411 /DNA_START=154 /DNA_END=741 /DNA_ORIENTATION=-
MMVECDGSVMVEDDRGQEGFRGGPEPPFRLLHGDPTGHALSRARRRRAVLARARCEAGLLRQSDAGWDEAHGRLGAALLPAQRGRRRELRYVDAARRAALRTSHGVTAHERRVRGLLRVPLDRWRSDPHRLGHRAGALLIKEITRVDDSVHAHSRGSESATLVGGGVVLLGPLWQARTLYSQRRGAGDGRKSQETP